MVEPYPSEKYESVGMMTFPIYWKIKNVPHQPDMMISIKKDIKSGTMLRLGKLLKKGGNL
jgi:hypothetical protein